jgi:hypothetical protein
MTNLENFKMENFELVTGYNSREISQMTPLDLLMRMRKKRSASELIRFRKKSPGIEVEFILRQKSTLLYQFVSYRI